MATSYLTNKSCIDNERKCNYIKPYTNKDVENLRFNSQQLNNFEVEYNRVCSLNNGTQIETCSMNLNDMNKLTDNEINYYNTIKNIYPFVRLFYNTDN